MPGAMLSPQGEHVCSGCRVVQQVRPGRTLLVGGMTTARGGLGMDGQDQSDDVISSPQQAREALDFVSAETPCPYLPDRLQRSEAYVASELDPGQYEHLMARGFRRSGRIVYRPRCRGCDACVPLRVLVERFRPTASMKRVWRRNREQRVEVGTPQVSAEKFDLFVRYLDYQHDDSMPRTFETFTEFLYVSPLETLEFSYYLGKRLAGVEHSRSVSARV